MTRMSFRSTVILLALGLAINSGSLYAYGQLRAGTAA